MSKNVEITEKKEKQNAEKKQITYTSNGQIQQMV